jgi:hypothetical protein
MCALMGRRCLNGTYYIFGITISRNWNLTPICFPLLTESTQEREEKSGARGDTRAWYAVALHLP